MCLSSRATISGSSASMNFKELPGYPQTHVHGRFAPMPSSFVKEITATNGGTARAKFLVNGKIIDWRNSPRVLLTFDNIRQGAREILVQRKLSSSVRFANYQTTEWDRESTCGSSLSEKTSMSQIIDDYPSTCSVNYIHREMRVNRAVNADQWKVSEEDLRTFYCSAHRAVFPAWGTSPL